MLDALYCVDFDIGLFVAGKIDVGEDQECLRAIGDVEGAVKAHRLDAAFLAAGLVEGVGQGDGLVVDLVGKMRWEQSDGQGNGRFDLYAEFLAIVVGCHQAVNLRRRRDLVFFVQNAAPVELGLNAIVHTGPTVVLDVKIVGGNEVPDAGPEDGANGRDDWLLGLTLVAKGDDHGALGGKMALVNRAGDMLPHAGEGEIWRGFGMLQRGVPFVGPDHSHCDRISGVDLHVHIAAAGSGMIDAAGVQAGWLQGDGFVVGRGPVENAILGICVRGAGAEKQRSENGKVLHSTSIGGVQARTLTNSRSVDYEGTKCPWRERG